MSAAESSLGSLERLVAAVHARVESAGRHRTYGLLDYADGQSALKPPYAAVLPLGETAGPNLSPGADLSGTLDDVGILDGIPESSLYAPSPAVHRVEAVVGVVCCVAARRKPEMRQLDDDAAPRRESDADATLAALVDAVRAALLGWLPAPAWWPLELRRGRLVAVEDGLAHWQDEFACAYLLKGGGERPAAGHGLPDDLCVSVDGVAQHVRLEDG